MPTTKTVHINPSPYKTPRMAAADYKPIIIEALDTLRKRDVANKELFKARAYAKVIGELKAHPAPITSYEDVASIAGIGDKISKKIKEILETGGLRAAELAKEKYNIAALDEFQNIYGVGPAKATSLVEAGFTSIAELREAIKTTPKLLNDKQKIGLKYYEDLLERITREEMMEHEDILHSRLPHTMEDYTCELVGSFRRQAETSGDIDVLIRIPHDTTEEETASNLSEYVKILQDFGYIEEVLALGDKKCMAICRMYGGKARRLDLLMTPDHEYATALLYFTGSDRFNVAFRQHALNRGYTLNEHALKPLTAASKPPPYFATENDIFRFLGLRYVEPSQRVDNNQIILRKRPVIVADS
jgi:DNA polymerase beta